MTSTSNFFLAAVLLVTSAGACASDEVDADLADTSVEAATPAHFDLWQTSGQYFFHVVAGNGEVMLASQAYRSRTNALGGVLSVLDNGALATRYRIATGKDGQSYVSLRAANGQVIATTEGYSTASSARRAVDASVAAVARYVEHWASATGARFEVFEGVDRRFYFNLHAANGAKVLRSEGYTTEAGALNGAFLLAELGVDPATYAVVPSVDGGFYLDVRAANHEIVATSEVYSSRSSALRARDAIVALLPAVELL